MAVLGCLVAFAGLEHGVGELLQRDRPLRSIVIESWDAPVFDQLGGEPAFTVAPSYALAGALTVLVATGYGILAVRAPRVRHAGPGLTVAAGLLFLVGGGFGPPIIGALVATLWVLAHSPPSLRPTPTNSERAWWRPLLVLTTGAFLALFPGTVLLHWLIGLNSAALVAVLTATAFLGLAATLPAALVWDRRQATPRRRPRHGSSGSRTTR